MRQCGEKETDEHMLDMEANTPCPPRPLSDFEALKAKSHLYGRLVVSGQRLYNSRPAIQILTETPMWSLERRIKIIYGRTWHQAVRQDYMRNVKPNNKCYSRQQINSQHFSKLITTSAPGLRLTQKIKQPAEKAKLQLGQLVAQKQQIDR